MNLSKLKSLNKFSSKGFTLIELLIVIAILGVLAAVVLIAINPGQRIAAARNARIRQDISNAGNSANVFNADTGLSATCPVGGTYPNIWGATICGQTYRAAPVDPTGTAFPAIVKLPAACDGTVANGACTSIAISAPAYPDPNSIPAVTNTTSLWCWKSTTGSITLVAAGGCTLP